MSRFNGSNSFNRDYNSGGRHYNIAERFNNAGGGDRFNNNSDFFHSNRRLAGNHGGFSYNSGGGYLTNYDRHNNNFSALPENARGLPNFRGRVIFSSVGKPMHSEPVIEVPDCHKISVNSSWGENESLNKAVLTSNDFETQNIVNDPKQDLEKESQNETWETDAKKSLSNNWHIVNLTKPVMQNNNANSEENKFSQFQENKLINSSECDFVNDWSKNNYEVGKVVMHEKDNLKEVVIHEEDNLKEHDQSKQSSLEEEAVKNTTEMSENESEEDFIKFHVNQPFKESLELSGVKPSKEVSLNEPVNKIFKNTNMHLDVPLNGVVKPTDPVEKIVASLEPENTKNLAVVIENLEKKIVQLIEKETAKELRQKAEWQETLNKLTFASGKFLDAFIELNNVIQSFQS